MSKAASRPSLASFGAQGAKSITIYTAARTKLRKLKAAEAAKKAAMANSTDRSPHMKEARASSCALRL